MSPGEPLAPLDAAFVAVETRAMPMQVMAVAVLAPQDGSGVLVGEDDVAAAGSGPDAGPAADRRRPGIAGGTGHDALPSCPLPLTVVSLRERVAERLADRRRLWQRLVNVPFGLDHPLWVDDAAVDLDHHVRRAALPSPGGPRELHELVALEAIRPLDPNRPLWELLLVEGLEGGHVAVVAKVHHALFDGVAGLAVLAGLFDQAPAPAPAPQAVAGSSAEQDTSPTGLRGTEVLAEVAHRWVRRPLALGDAVAGTYLAWRQRPGPRRPEQGGGAAGQAVADPTAPPAGRPDGVDDASIEDAGVEGGWTTVASGEPALGPRRPFGAPRAPWNGTVSPRRRCSVLRLGLRDLRTVTECFGGTVNDVLLAAVAAALRQRAAADPSCPGLQPGAPLTAGVPVSVRSTSSSPPEGNRVVAVIVGLATDVPDPLARYRQIVAGTDAAKRWAAVLPDQAVRGWAELAVPAITQRLVRLAANLRMFDRLAPPVNVVVSNLTGPVEPLSLAGLALVDLVPFGPVVDGVGLNLTAVSYRGTLTVGVHSCSDRLADVDRLALDVVDGATELVKLAAEVRAGSPAADLLH